MSYRVALATQHLSDAGKKKKKKIEVSASGSPGVIMLAVPLLCLFLDMLPASGAMGVVTVVDFGMAFTAAVSFRYGGGIAASVALMAGLLYGTISESNGWFTVIVYGAVHISMAWLRRVVYEWGSVAHYVLGGLVVFAAVFALYVYSAMEAEGAAMFTFFPLSGLLVKSAADFAVFVALGALMAPRARDRGGLYKMS